METIDLPITNPDRYRSVPEGRIVSFLLSPYEIARGNRDGDLPTAQGVLDRCVALGLPFRTNSSGTRLFDMAEVVNFIRHAYFAWQEPTWMARAVNMLRRLMAESVPGAPFDRPPDLAALQPGRFTVHITRRFNLSGHAPGSLLRLRLPIPIAGPTLSDVAVKLVSPPSNVVDTTMAAGRLDLRVAVPAEQETSLTVAASFTAIPAMPASSARLDEAERTLYLAESEGLIKVTERVQALAWSRNGNDAETTLRSFWDLLFDEFILAFVHYDVIDPRDPLAWVLDHRRFDCLLGSALLAALCRARGIPARIVSGYTLNPVLPTAHTWCEIWTDAAGWRSFDFYSLDLAGGDRDSAWRWHFFGRIDHRFIAERPPRLFCGTGAVRLPPAWQMVSQTIDGGSQTSFEDLETGRLIYSESVKVKRETLETGVNASPLRPVTITVAPSKS